MPRGVRGAERSAELWLAKARHVALRALVAACLIAALAPAASFLTSVFDNDQLPVEIIVFMLVMERLTLGLVIDFTSLSGRRNLLRHVAVGGLEGVMSYWFFAELLPLLAVYRDNRVDLPGAVFLSFIDFYSVPWLLVLAGTFALLRVGDWATKRLFRSPAT